MEEQTACQDSSASHFVIFADLQRHREPGPYKECLCHFFWLNMCLINRINWYTYHKGNLSDCALLYTCKHDQKMCMCWPQRHDRHNSNLRGVPSCLTRQQVCFKWVDIAGWWSIASFLHWKAMVDSTDGQWVGCNLLSSCSMSIIPAF